MIEAIEAEGLAVTRGERRLFEDLGFRLAAGEAMALTGPNGSGKTTLLRALAGFIAPAAGEIRFLGPEGLADANDARRAGVHFLAHQDALKNSRTARDELMFQSRWTGGDPAAALDAADRLGLRQVLDLAVRRLSAGQRRRVALARLIASPRPAWLLDEPMAPLDARHRELFASAMALHLAGGGLILAAAHDCLPVAARELRLAG